MALETAVVVVASILAAILLAQTILLVVIAVAFRRWCARTGSAVDQISRSVEPVLQGARELLAESREKIAVVGGNLNEISALAKNQMVRLDGFLKETTDRAQVQLVRLDQLLEDTMYRIDQTTEAVQRGVLKPVREITAVMAGVRTALQFFWNRNRRTVERATQDEELFI
jgi:hypothetical protein